MVSLYTAPRMVPCDIYYWEFVRQLRNDPRVKQGFIDQNDISIENHQRYMVKHQKNYWICIANDNPTGYVGVVNHDIRVCVHPKYQNLGLGKFMINYIMSLHPTATAQIKKDNENSIKLFKSCGFEITQENNVGYGEPMVFMARRYDYTFKDKK